MAFQEKNELENVTVDITGRFVDDETESTNSDDTITLIDTNPGDQVNGPAIIPIPNPIEVFAGGGNDLITITNGTDSGTLTARVNGGNGNDTISVSYEDAFDSGNDIIDGDDGNDSITVTGNTGGTDVESINGGDGADIITATDIENASISGDPDIDLIGSDDVITVTNSSNMFIEGEGGDDDIIVIETTGTIEGDDGADDIYISLSSGTVSANGANQLASEGEDSSDNFYIDSNSGGEIVLDDFSFDDGGLLGGNPGNNDVLYVWDGSDPASAVEIDLNDLLDDGIVAGFTTGGRNTSPEVGTFNEARFDLVGGGVLEIDNVEVACFMNGTSIATPAGEVAVETLAIGDMVTTADGTTAPVKWMGRREVSSVFATKNASVQPILITQGALGNGLPTADLRVSPDHAMYVDGVLVHAEALVNGSSIVREAIAETFTYYHIELENHDLVLANGAAAETFVDSDVRARFDNAAEYVALYGTTESAAPMSLPRVKSKRQLSTFIKNKLLTAKQA